MYEGTGERHGQARRRIVRHSIVQWFREDSFADNQTRYAALKTALAVPEGVLSIVDEGGVERVGRRVRVVTADLPPQWGRHMLEVKIEFEGLEEMPAATQGATFTADAEAAVSLGDVRSFTCKEDTTRFSTEVPNRKESLLSVSARGSIRADPSLTPAARRTYLLGQEAVLRACNRKDGILQFSAAWSERVRVTSLVADVADATDELQWSLSAEMLTFPSGSQIVANWKVTQSDDTANSERLTRVAGTIRALDEAAALAQRDAIQTVWTSAARPFKGGEWTASLLDGADGATDTKSWDFVLHYREPLPGAVPSFVRKISTKTDSATGLILTTYSGRVTAISTAAALAACRAWGKDVSGLPMKVSEEEDVGEITLGGSNVQHTEVIFAYAYHTRGAEQHAEVTSEVQRDRFGPVVQTVSGYAVAATSGAALTLAQTFKVPTVTIVSEVEGTATDYHQSNSLFKRIAFTYRYRLAASSTSVEYTDGVEVSFDGRENIRTMEGTVYAADESTADSAITSLVSGMTGRWIKSERRSHNLSSNAAVFSHRTFCISRATVLSNSEDILEAEATVSWQPSFTQAKLTLIPFSTAHVQSNVGTAPGRMVASGYCKAVNEATAQAWARGWTPGSGYQTERDDEQHTTFYYPRTGTSSVDPTVMCNRVGFTYAREYTVLALP